jgi:hypothetical protein
MKVVRLSALRTNRLYHPGNIPGTDFFWMLILPQGHNAAGRIVSLKNSNDTIGNRARDLPACSAVPYGVTCDIWKKIKIYLRLQFFWLLSFRLISCTRWGSPACLSLYRSIRVTNTFEYNIEVFGMWRRVLWCECNNTWTKCLLGHHIFLEIS